MQSATVDGPSGSFVVAGVAVLSQEQLYRIKKVAAGLNRDVEGMLSNVREYLQGIADSLTPENGDEPATPRMSAF